MISNKQLVFTFDNSLKNGKSISVDRHLYIRCKKNKTLFKYSQANWIELTRVTFYHFSRFSMVSLSSVSSEQMYGHGFNRWMTSGEDNDSLWSNEPYRDALLTYIGRMYGQKNQMDRIFTKLEHERERMDELDFLNVLLRKTEEQSGVREIFREWNNKMRPRKRFNELKSLFNLDRACDKFKISSVNLQNIDPHKIHAYFDLGCSTGEITARLGKHLGLKKENIFGGDIYHRATKEITFVPIDEFEPIINLREYFSPTT